MDFIISMSKSPGRIISVNKITIFSNKKNQKLKISGSEKIFFTRKIVSMSKSPEGIFSMNKKK